MDLAQIAYNAQQLGGLGGLSLLSTGLLLGLRHGIDWDHIAAITDISSTTTAVEVTQPPAGDRKAPAGLRFRPAFGHLELRAMWLSLLYAIGHAAVVFVLGVLALSLAAVLPEWIDPLMERVVGVTLLVLGLWVFYSLAQYLRGKGDFRLQSRWMLVFAGVRHAWHRVQHALGGEPHSEPFRVDRYGPRTALGVGLIHGVGAETGSQALLIAAVGGASSQGLGLAMLLAFTLGLVISNSLVALLASTGYISSARARPFYLLIGLLTGVFSLVVGAFFVFGLGTQLPDLQQVLGLAENVE
jgi:cytochrome c biogenesis protein CcdA